MRTKLLILSIIVSAGFSFADDAVLFGNMLETDLILTPAGVTNAILTTALTAESDPIAYPVATNALAVAEGALTAEADTLATVTARGATTTNAVTIGSRDAGAVGPSSVANGLDVVASGDYSHAEGGGTTASGAASHAEGTSTTASGEASHAEGANTTASGDYSHASGFQSVASHITAFAWQGSDGGYSESPYGSHGPGTFNINPVGGLAGFYIGETPLSATLSGYATTGAVAAVQAAIPDVAALYMPTESVEWALTNTIALSESKAVYMVSVTNDTVVAFDFSAVDFSKGVAVWQTWFDVANMNCSVTLPGTNLVQYIEAPDLATKTEPQLLQIAWQAWVSGTTTNVQGNLYARNPEE